MQPTYSPYNNQYKQQRLQEIQSASRIDLIIMLLEGAVSYNRKALLAQEKGDKILILESIESASKIIMHLYSCLDFEKGGEIAKHLGDLYDYICDRYVSFRKIILRQNEQDPAVLNSINQVLGHVLEAWKQLPKDGGV